MTGLIYKEVRQNRQYLWFVGLFAPLILLLFLLFLLIMAASSDTSFSDLFSDMTLTGENGLQLSMIMFYCGLLPFGITGMFSLFFSRMRPRNGAILPPRIRRAFRVPCMQNMR